MAHQILKCKLCSKAFNHRCSPSDISSGRAKFCSVICRQESRRKLPKTYICLFCGNEKDNKYGKIKKYCSRSCVDKSRLGNTAWNKGKSNIYSLEVRKSMGRFNLGRIPWNKGKKGVMPTPINKGKGVKCGLQILIRQSDKYISWRSKVLELGGYKCVKCRTSKNLHVHHKNSFAIILIKNKVDNYDKAMVCDELWELSNGEINCKKCHHEIHKKKFKEKAV